MGIERREGPGFAAVCCESQVGAVLIWMFVVASGDYAVSGVAKGDGENSGGVGAVDDGSRGDLPGLSAVGGVEDAGYAAPGGEPDVEVGKGVAAPGAEARFELGAVMA